MPAPNQTIEKPSKLHGHYYVSQGARDGGEMQTVWHEVARESDNPNTAPHTQLFYKYYNGV